LYTIAIIYHISFYLTFFFAFFLTSIEFLFFDFVGLDDFCARKQVKNVYFAYSYAFILIYSFFMQIVFWFFFFHE